jgi:hypothetical protein
VRAAGSTFVSNPGEFAMKFHSRLLRKWRPRLERLEDRTVPAQLVALAGNDHLLTFDSGSPGTILKNVAVSGLAQGDELGGIAYSPGGKLYGVSIANFTVDHVYELNPNTGNAALITGNSLNLFTESGQVAVSFDPLTSKMRVVDDFGNNAVATFTPTGSEYSIVTAGETHFVAGDINARFAAEVSAMAYSNQFAGAASSTLYGIATTTLPWLVSIGGPGGNPSADTGQVNSLIAIDAPGVQSFTVGGKSNAAFWTYGDDLHSIDLDSGTTGLLGTIPSTALPSHATVRSLAVEPIAENPEVSIGDAVAVQDAHLQGHAVFAVTLSDSSDQSVTVHYATVDDTAKAGRDYTAVSGALTFAPGEVSREISVPIQKMVTATPENFFVRLSAPAHADLGRSVAIGTIRAIGQQLFLAAQYDEDFSDAPTSAQPAFDGTGVFQHTFVDGNLQHTVNNPLETDGTSYHIETAFTAGNPALSVYRGMDRITFPNLAPGVHVGFAKVEIPFVSLAEVRVIGLNGAYDFAQDFVSGSSVSVGEEHVLTSGQELGPIQEIDLIAIDRPSIFDNVRILAVPDRPPSANDDFIDTPPNTPAIFNPLVNDSSQDGSPLRLVGFTQASHGRVELAPPGSGNFTYTPAHGYESPNAASADTFTYTVEDALGQRGTGTVHIFVHSPPTISNNTFTFSTSLTTVTDETNVGVRQVNDFGGPDTMVYQFAHVSLRNDRHLDDGNAVEGSVLNSWGHVVGTFALPAPIATNVADFSIQASPDSLHPGPLPVTGELNLANGELTVTWDTGTLPATFASSVLVSYTADAPFVISSPDRGLLARNGLDPQQAKAVLLTGPSHGLLEFHDDGTFIYTPTQHDQLDVPAAVFGSDSFTWTANDGLDSNVGTVTISQGGGFVTRTFLFNVNRTFSHVDFVTHGADNIEVGHLHIPLGVTIYVHPSTHSPETFLPASGLLGFASAFGVRADELTQFAAPGDPTQHPQITIKLTAPPHKGSLWTDKGFLDGVLQLGPHDPIYTDPDQSGDLNSDGSFWFVPADDFLGTDQFTYQIIVSFTANGQSYQVASADTTVLLSSNGSNGTGVYYYDDNLYGTPTNYDGNGDGIPDRLEDNVASLRIGGIGNNFVTFESPRPAGHPTQLLNVTSYESPPSTPPAPAGASFPAGFFRFQVVGLEPGEATTVEIYLSNPLQGDPSTWTLWRLGKTPRDESVHWYQFLYQKQTDNDEASTTGAEFLDNSHILLHFVDGGRGDDDLMQDGIITDPGAIAFSPTPTATLESDPMAAGKSRLIVTGTPGNDVITLTAVDALGNIDVMVNGESLGTFQPTGHILINSFDGDDTVRLKSTTSRAGIRRIGVPVVIRAGNGRDTLDASGSSADNVLAAGTGVSKLIDGFGRDILIGSPQSSFFASRGDNLIIKGVTPFNTDPAALLGLLAEWDVPGEKDATRIDHLLHGGGANGNVVLVDAVVATSARNTLLATPLGQARPTLIGPKGTLPVTDVTPVLTWNPIAGADHYRVHIDDLTARKNDVVEFNVTVSTLTPPGPLVQGHTYRWWVQAFDALGNASLNSPGLSFHIVALSRPKLLGPAGTNAGTAPSFTWRAVDGADHYQIVLLDTSAGRPSLVATTADQSQTNWTLAFPLTVGHRYRWRVRALGPAGSVGQWSGWAAFTS